MYLHIYPYVYTEIFTCSCRYTYVHMHIQIDIHIEETFVEPLLGRPLQDFHRVIRDIYTIVCFSGSSNFELIWALVRPK